MPDASPSKLPTETTEFGLQPLGGSLVLVVLLAVVCFVLVAVAYARHPAHWRHRVVLALMRAGLIVLFFILMANTQIYTISVHYALPICPN